MDALEDPIQHDRVVRAFSTAFERRVAPRLSGLRRQVIHNDFNPHNVLVSHEDHACVTGILDFGDMVHTPLIVDLATACAYQVSPAARPLQSVGEFAAAYNAVIPLDPAEMAVLLDLIMARLITTIVITNWRARRYPANRTYILRNTWPLLGGIRSAGRRGRRRGRRLFLAHLRDEVTWNEARFDDGECLRARQRKAVGT